MYRILFIYFLAFLIYCDLHIVAFSMNSSKFFPSNIEINFLENAQYIRIIPLKDEADEMERRCADGIMNTYFNCKCVAGIFLVERQKRGSPKLQGEIIENDQSQIMDDIYFGRVDNKNCIDEPKIKQSFYNECLHFSRSFRKKNRDNENFCNCTSGNVVSLFIKDPIPRPSFINKLRLYSMKICEKQYPIKFK